MTETIFITGASRGLGLELTTEYLARGSKVIATCRNPQQASALTQLTQHYGEALEILALDVNQESQITAIKAKLQSVKIDILINNAGIYGPSGLRFGQISASAWLETLATNTVAPFLIAQALWDNVAKSSRKIIVNITSKMGSIADNTSGSSYIYRSSKAALNAAMKSLALDLMQHHITVLLLHPGWVKTDMGGSNAPLSIQESVQHMIRVLDQISIQDTGSFLDYEGKLLSW